MADADPRSDPSTRKTVDLEVEDVRVVFAPIWRALEEEVLEGLSRSSKTSGHNAQRQTRSSRSGPRPAQQAAHAARKSLAAYGPDVVRGLLTKSPHPRFHRPGDLRHIARRDRPRQVGGLRILRARREHAVKYEAWT